MYYTAFNLIIDSELDLPELQQTENSVADLTIRYGNVADKIPNPIQEGVRFQFSESELMYRVDQVAAYRVIAGREIIVDPVPDVDDESVRTFLLGSGLGVILMQRGILPLHASGVVTDKGAVLFTGPSGAGKSTITASLCALGYPMITDDVSGLVIEDGRHFVLPGYPRQKLWADSLKSLAISSEGRPRVRPQLDKYTIDVHDFVDGKVPVASIYILSPFNVSTPEFKELTGLKKLQALRGTEIVYREFYANHILTPGRVMSQLMSLSKQVRVVSVKRPAVNYETQAFATAVEADFSQ